MFQTSSLCCSSPNPFVFLSQHSYHIPFNYAVQVNYRFYVDVSNTGRTKIRVSLDNLIGTSIPAGGTRSFGPFYAGQYTLSGTCWNPWDSSGCAGTVSIRIPVKSLLY